MDLLSRMALIAVGRALCDSGLLDRRTNKVRNADIVGLIAATRLGSLITDLAFCETMGQGTELASPTVFSYTLPNIALAEAAGHFGLTGPVYS
ncbi:MAG: beta-ketoacyl synthase N-terminal-like domain-containing protein, partial [Thermodesulfobacteriota bacterium]|nr:beta-ketoacyl synthase N-terminal-like domain-containing protein [Thermodesulfobacteriota bacterium]